MWPPWLSESYHPRYSRTSVETWLRVHDTDPLSNAKMRNKRLVPNNLVRLGIVFSLWLYL